MDEAVPVRVVEVHQYVRNVTCRMPFRYGSATLTAVPVVHLRTTVEADGERVEGWSADCLPPAWFDKRPGRTYADDLTSLRWSIATAIDCYLTAGRGTSFALWLAAHAAVGEAATARGETGLTAGFGPALVERSVIDAVGKLAGLSFARVVHANLLGCDLAALHPELAGVTPNRVLHPEPLETIGVRHTVGLSDPLTEADLTPDQRLDDGLPQTLEEYLHRRGVRYLKIKLSGQREGDLARLRAIAELLERSGLPRCIISLDGNEQYQRPEPLLELLEDLAAEPRLAGFLAGVQYIEQPFGRDVALAAELTAGVTALSAVRPVIIDESDDRLEAFRLAVERGYRGTSVKNCKGVTKAIANYALAWWLSLNRPGGPYFLTGEDLLNTAVVPLHQDLATAALLGLPHVERNGHHYVRGLDHLSPREQTACARQHESLYMGLGRYGQQVALCDGLLDLRSLNVVGYAVGFAPDWNFLTPLERWRSEDLQLG